MSSQYTRHSLTRLASAAVVLRTEIDNNDCFPLSRLHLRLFDMGCSPGFLWRSQDKLRLQGHRLWLLCAFRFLAHNVVNKYTICAGSLLPQSGSGVGRYELRIIIVITRNFNRSVHHHMAFPLTAEKSFLRMKNTDYHEYT
jgi:hypothetical protein